MNLNMGSQRFNNVKIPLLWGKRAIIQGENGISIILLEDNEVILEVLSDKPAPNVQYELIEDGFKIIKDGEDIYSFDSKKHIITGLSLKLPECEINNGGIRVGTNMFSGNIVVGYGVGIYIDEQGGMGMGAPLPTDLAKLVV